MRFFCATGLAVAAAMTWAADLAHAQAGLAYATSAVPWSGGDSSSATQAGYYSNQPASPPPTVGQSVNDGQYAPYRSQFDDALHSQCCDDCCPAPDPCHKWYAVATGLAMTRNRAPAFWTTNTSGSPNDVRLNTQNAKADWTGGGQITVGFAPVGNGGPAVAFTFWALAPMSGFGSVSDTTGNPATALDSKIDWTGITINGQPGAHYFDNAQTQAVWRKDRTYNFELNLQTSTYTTGNFQVAALAGFRYFHFTDDLTYGSASFGNSFSSNGGADAAYYNINCRNNLFGGQVGAVINSIMTDRFTFFAVPKVGVFGNGMHNHAQVYAGNAINTPDINIALQKTDASILSEIDLGFSWAFRHNWWLTYGYRVVSITNVSLADNQFASYGHVEQSGSLILHGAFVGLGWMF